MAKIYVACYDCGEQHAVEQKPSAWREICSGCKDERRASWEKQQQASQGA